MRVAGLAVVAVLALCADARAMPPHEGAGVGALATIAYADYAPSSITVLAGDTVTWHNDSLRAHTVTAEDGSYDSQRLAPGANFAHRFDQVGPQPFFCTLHSFMRGEVDVRRVVLDAPREPTAPRRPYVITGRAALPAGADVRLQADAGDGFRDAGSATVGQDGALQATVTPTASASYRAVAGTDESPAVNLLVLNRRLTVTASTRARRATVRAQVTPASPGATVVLQLRLPDRFGWWPVASRRAGADGGVRFRVPVGRRVAARVVLTLADGATRLASSRTFHLGG